MTDDIVIGYYKHSMEKAQLADMKKTERALLRLNPKVLGRGAYFQVRRSRVTMGSFCVVGAVRAANTLGKDIGVPATDTAEMAFLAYSGKGAQFEAHTTIDRLIEVNDGFRGTIQARYHHVLAFVQKEIARLEKENAA